MHELCQSCRDGHPINNCQLLPPAGLFLDAILARLFWRFEPRRAFCQISEVVNLKPKCISGLQPSVGLPLAPIGGSFKTKWPGLPRHDGWKEGQTQASLPGGRLRGGREDRGSIHQQASTPQSAQGSSPKSGLREVIPGGRSTP